MRRSILLIVVLIGLFGCAPKVEVVVKDEVAPVISGIQFEENVFTVAATDNTEVVAYLYTRSNVKPEKYDEAWQASNTFSVVRGGLFYFWAKDKEGNVSSASSNAFYRVVNKAPFETEITLFKEGLLAALDPDTDRWGYIDITGSFVIDPKYDDAYNFRENGLALVELNDRYVVIDKTAKVVAGPSANRFIITENGLIYESDSPNIYDSTGALISVLPSTIDGYSDNHWYKSDCIYYDENGTVKLNYSGDWTCHNFVNGMAFIEESGNFDEYDVSGLVGHYIDTSGNKVIESFETPNYEETIFDNLSSLPVYGLGGNWESFYFSTSGTAVKKGSNGLLGYVDKTGEWVITPKFAKAGAFNDLGVAVVAVKNSSGDLIYGLINQTGKYILSPRYELIWKYYANMTAFLDSKGNLGYLNAKGVVVIKPNATWSTASAFFEDGYARVKNQEGEFGVIDQTGRLVIDYIFPRLN